MRALMAYMTENKEKPPCVSEIKNNNSQTTMETWFFSNGNGRREKRRMCFFKNFVYLFIFLLWFLHMVQLSLALVFGKKKFHHAIASMKNPHAKNIRYRGVHRFWISRGFLFIAWNCVMHIYVFHIYRDRICLNIFWKQRYVYSAHTNTIWHINFTNIFFSSPVSIRQWS